MMNHAAIVKGCVVFHSSACKLYNAMLKDPLQDQAEYANNWRNLLESFMDIQKDALEKITDFCEVLSDSK